MHRLTYWSRFSEEVRHDIDDKQKSKQIISVYNTNNNNIEFIEDDFQVEKYHSDNGSVNSNGNSYKNKQDVVKEKTNLKWLYLLFCMNSQREKEMQMRKQQFDEMNEGKLSPEQQAIEDSTKAKEDRIQGNICNVSAIILVIIGSFVWGFFFV